MTAARGKGTGATLSRQQDRPPERVAWIDAVDPGDAEPELQELYSRVCDPVSGDLDHILQVHSLHPAGLRAHFELYSAVMRSTKGLRKVDREMIALVVSQANECHY